LEKVLSKIVDNFATGHWMRNLDARFEQRNSLVKLHRRKVVHDGVLRRKLRLEPTKENAAVKSASGNVWGDGLSLPRERELFFCFISQAGLFYFQQALDFCYEDNQLVGVLLFFGQLEELLPAFLIFSDHAARLLVLTDMCSMNVKAGLFNVRRLEGYAENLLCAV
jgi:hypothetical protein